MHALLYRGNYAKSGGYQSKEFVLTLFTSSSVSSSMSSLSSALSSASSIISPAKGGGEDKGSGLGRGWEGRHNVGSLREWG